ncbi:MAG: ATP-binding protein [Chitinophagales bacterium]|nr:ATP-binding protein [Chitinophagales bacterium]MDW8418206.1 ATP-binding protein [Chitinophagales bacterium]
MTTDAVMTLEELIRTAEHYIDLRKPEAFPLVLNAIEQAEQSNDTYHFLYARYTLGMYYCLVENDYDKALDTGNDIFNKLPQEYYDKLGYKVCILLGNVHQLKGEIDISHDYYIRGMKILESKKELNNKEKLFLASFYYNTALLFNQSAFNINTEEYILKAIELYTETNSKSKLSKCLIAYNNILNARGEHTQALKNLERSLEIETELNDAYGIALVKANIGSTYLYLQQPDKAYVMLMEALSYYETNEKDYETGMVLLSISDVYSQKKMFREAVTELKRAEVLFHKLNNKRELTTCYLNLANALSALGNFEEAFHYQKKYTGLLEEFFDTDKTNAIIRAKKQFESEQKEKEAALLREKNEEINRYAHQLEVSNNELKQFAHVASHDLKEPLRMIYSFLHLLKKSLDGNLSEQQEQFLHFAMDGATRMEKLIVNLLRLAKVDANVLLEKVNLNSVMEEVKLNLTQLLADKNGRVVFHNLPEVQADRTQMLLLFQNLTSNGIKYNQSDSPVVNVNCTYADEYFEISVKDNGIGIPAQHRDKVFNIFQRLHHDDKKYEGTGIGLALCKKIVDKMNGDIRIAESGEAGTTFVIRFPKNLLLS